MCSAAILAREKGKLLFKKDNYSGDNVQFNGINQLLLTLSVHYLSCTKFIADKRYGNIARVAQRFIKIEGSMINKVSTKFDRQTDLQRQQGECHYPVISNYTDMYQRNIALISYLKSTIKQFDSHQLAAFFSYWVAALQVENDEMAKHL